MANSRKRNRRKTPSYARRARRRREGGQVISVRAGQDLEPFLTADDRASYSAGIEAASRGDAAAALHHELEGLVVLESPYRHKLRELVALGDDAPAWVYSRWCADTAYRWMMFEEDPRIEKVVRYLLATTHLDHLGSIVDDPVRLKEYGTLIGACDWLCSDIALFEYAGLADFLDVRVQSGMLDRTDRVRDWAEAPMGVYAYRDVSGRALVLHDLAHDTEVEVLNLGALTDRYPEDLLLGRVVPISAAPGRMFASRPLALDDVTGRDAAEQIRAGRPLGWMDALITAREDGRLDRGFSCHDHTLFTTDLPIAAWAPGDDAGELEEAPAIRDLIDRGYSAEVANALGVLEVGLIAADVSPGSLVAAAPYVAAALVTPGAFAAALMECTRAEVADGWQALAEATPDHVSNQCLELAVRSRAG